MGYTKTADGTRIVATPEWALGQLACKRITDGKVSMKVDGSPSSATIIWNGTGENDTGGDWTRSGEGSESTAAKKSGTNGLNTTVTSENDTSVFDNGSMVDVDGTYGSLQFWIRAKVYPVGSDPVVFWRDSSNVLVGVEVHLNDYVEDFSDDTEWHLVAIPISDFALTTNVQKLVFRYEGVGGQRYFIDDIELYSTGGFVYRAAATATEVYHLKDVILTFVEENGTWDSGDFTAINGGLSNGLLLRHRRLSTGEVLWKINFKSNITLFGRLNVLNDVEYSTSVHQFTLALDPTPAMIKVTSDDVIEWVVRDDLTTINDIRSFLRYGREEVAA